MFFGEQFGYMTWTIDVGYGGGEANVILNRCEKGAICSKDNDLFP